MKPATKASILLVLAALSLSGATPYQKPPQAVLDVLHSPLTPTLAISPSRHFAMQGQPIRYPPIAELAQPMLRIAGMRINPKTNGLHNTTFNSSLSLRKIPEGTEIKVALPPNAKLTLGRWSPDATRFAFTNTTERGIELWLGDTTGKTRKIEGVRLNAVMGGGGGGRGGGGAGPSEVHWMFDGKTLLVQMVKPNRGSVPDEPLVPTWPHVQESLGGASPEVTHEDMLRNSHDEDLFEYLRHLAAYPRRCRHRQDAPHREGRHRRIGAHLARWQVPPRHHHPPPLLLPARRARVPQGNRDLGPLGQSDPQYRQLSAGRSGAHQRRDHRTAQPAVASQCACDPDVGRSSRQRRPQD